MKNSSAVLIALLAALAFVIFWLVGRPPGQTGLPALPTAKTLPEGKSSAASNPQFISVNTSGGKSGQPAFGLSGGKVELNLDGKGLLALAKKGLESAKEYFSPGNRAAKAIERAVNDFYGPESPTGAGVNVAPFRRSSLSGGDPGTLDQYDYGDDDFPSTPKPYYSPVEDYDSGSPYFDHDFTDSGAVGFDSSDNGSSFANYA